MSYHDQPVLQPYFDIGKGSESIQHMATLEMLDEQLDAFSDPSLCLAHGSILSEIADTYTKPRFFDAGRANEALDKSDAVYDAASFNKQMIPIVGREVIFNSMRRELVAGQMQAMLRPALSELTGLALDVSSRDYLDPRHKAGFISEMLALGIPLWLTLERQELLEDDEGQTIIGWPSYMRQDKARAIPLAGGSGLVALPKTDFDMRLSSYGQDWTEVEANRKEVQIKSRTSPAIYDPSVIVAFMWRIGNIRKPAEAISMAGRLGTLPRELRGSSELNQVRHLAHGFLEHVEAELPLAA
jgi:hypothetical protein